MKVKQRVMRNGEVKIEEVSTVPFSAESESFSLYSPNVPEGHPLFGVVIKVRAIAKQITFLGMDEFGNAMVNVQSETIVALE